MARLVLLGPRAAGPLGEALRRGSRDARLGALAVVERRPMEGLLPILLALVAGPDEEVACRAAEVAASGYPVARTVRALVSALETGRPPIARTAVSELVRLHAAGMEEPLDPLLGVLLDEEADDALRTLAAGVLEHLPPAERAPVTARLRSSGSRLLRRRGEGAERPPRPPKEGPVAILALHAQLRRLGRSRGGPASRALAERRGGLHRELARLGSRVALYDLREALAVRPIHAVAALLEAVSLVGDRTFVPILARLAADEPAMEPLAATTLAALVGREKLRRTTSPFSRLAPRDRAALERIWPPGVNRARRRPR
ncbi:MAG TPA: hypothetical protein VIC87_12715 [Vicinamibacteria bacterium]